MNKGDGVVFVEWDEGAEEDNGVNCELELGLERVGTAKDVDSEVAGDPPDL